jgi:hypothetical protein
MSSIRHSKLDVDIYIAIAHMGYHAAESSVCTKFEATADWYHFVNSCPYGPSILSDKNSDPKAEAWYDGFWFFFYVVKPWRDACGTA